MKIEVRRINGATWVKLEPGLAVVPVRLLDELREVWTGRLADAVERGEALVNVGLDGGDGRMQGGSNSRSDGGMR